MFKEDGRLKPAEDIEMANLKGKKLACPKCGHETIITGTEFSKKYTCSNCGEELNEEFGSETGQLRS